MRLTDLAAALDLSASMVSRLVKHGMPRDSVERAMRWRKRNIAPGRMKGQRFDPANLDAAAAVVAARRSSAAPRQEVVSSGERHARAPHDPQVVDELLATLSRHMKVAASALAAGDLELVVEDLRSAMRAVPPSCRHRCLVDLAVMDALTEPAHEALREFATAGDQVSAALDVNAKQWADMGSWWYQIACGELVVAPHADGP